MTAEAKTASSETTAVQSAPRRGLLRRLLWGLGLCLLGLLITVLMLWAVLAILLADTHSGPRRILAVMFVMVALAVALFVRPRRRLLLSFAILFAAVLGWFFLLRPSNSRDWAPEVAQLPWASIDGERLIVHNVRNFDYRSETDFSPNWTDRSYDLSKLKTADFMLVYWGSKAIAHAMVSFGFDDGQHLAISIETRRERSESYSALEGFFRQYELYYVFADERDVIRLRTNYRKEDVYLYRTTLTPGEARDVLLSYIRRANSLKDRPDFYNALTSNCATNVVEHAQDGKLPSKLSWEILLSGYAARQAYRNGRVDTSMPFEQLEARSRINDAALAADKDPDFSRAIRAGLPTPAKLAAMHQPSAAE